MIDRDGRFLVFHCDSCPDYYETDTSDFGEGWDAAKRDGWRAKKISDEWFHTCPECAESLHG